jgi:flagellar biosynthesis protein FlhG
MSLDQAHDLRRMVLHAGRGGPNDSAPPPKIVVVCGGKGGVGTTTVAVNLAILLAREGRRVVLVDADFAGPDVSTLCGIEEPYGAAEVLSGRRTVHEVLSRGPGGIQVLPATRGVTEASDCTPAAQERLIAQLEGLGPHADFVLIDAGSGSGRVMRRFWEAAHAVLLVTHPDDVAVMDAYAVIKLVCHETPRTAAVAAVANCVDDSFGNGPSRADDDVPARLDRACRRFLGMTVACAGRIPFDPCVPRAAAAESPVVIETPGGQASTALLAMASQLPRLFEAEAPLGPHYPHAATG